MIEVPRAALTADEIAEDAEFFTFGTNDLTQTTFGYSRDDAEGKFLLQYVETQDPAGQPVPDARPRRAWASLMRMAVEKGRADPPGPEGRHLRRARRRPRRASPSATRSAWTTCPARRSACRSRGWRRRRRRSTVPRCATASRRRSDRVRFGHAGEGDGVTGGLVGSGVAVGLADGLADGVGLAGGDGAGVADGIGDDVAAGGERVALGRGDGGCVGTTTGGRCVAGAGDGVGGESVALGMAAVAVGEPPGVASGVPVVPSTAPAGRSGEAIGAGDARLASSCVAPTPTISAPITPAVAAPTHRTRPRAASGASREAGSMVRPRSIARSASSAATRPMHSPQTDACSAASRGGSPGAPSASHVQKV